MTMTTFTVGEVVGLLAIIVTLETAQIGLMFWAARSVATEEDVEAVDESASTAVKAATEARHKAQSAHSTAKQAHNRIDRIDTEGSDA